MDPEAVVNAWLDARNAGDLEWVRALYDEEIKAP